MWYRVAVTGVLLGILFAVGLPVFAQEPEILQEQFWVELDPLDISNMDPPDTGPIIRRLADEAHWIFSGMVYGFRFRYVPYDRGRGIGEVFEIELIHEVEARDIALVNGREEDNRLYGFFRYQLKSHEQQRFDSWQSNTIPSAGGRGAASLGLGSEGRLRAHEQALKEAVRNYLRPRERNKPKVISGVLLIEKAPHMSIDSGNYQSLLKVKIRLREIEAWEVR